jgi:hypothetical protein
MGFRDGAEFIYYIILRKTTNPRVEASKGDESQNYKATS